MLNHPIARLDHDEKLRHAAYRGMFDQPQDALLIATIRDATNGGYPLASDAFKATVLEPLGARTARGKPGPQRKTSQAERGRRYFQQLVFGQVLDSVFER